MDLRPWHFLRDGQCDRARAGPQISDNGAGMVRLISSRRSLPPDLVEWACAGPDLELEERGTGDVLRGSRASRLAMSSRTWGRSQRRRRG
jgi:hypothetical protein